jgi:uncharacterized protein
LPHVWKLWVIRVASLSRCFVGRSVTDNRIGVRFQYEWHDAVGNWFRSYGNELWEFDARGLMRRREASINDVAIRESERTFFWPAPGPRPTDHSGIPDVK